MLFVGLIGLAPFCTNYNTSPQMEIRNFFSIIEDIELSKHDTFLLLDSVQTRGWSDLFNLHASHDNILTKPQINSIVNQIDTTSSPRLWTNELIPKAKILSGKYLDSIGDKSPVGFGNSLYYLSKPYFTDDKKYAILYFSSYCGMLCGKTSINVYRKADGKWKLFKRYVTSMS